jgi:tetratricopeptide (TPR) repeat protein
MNKFYLVACSMLILISSYSSESSVQIKSDGRIRIISEEQFKSSLSHALKNVPSPDAPKSDRIQYLHHLATLHSRLRDYKEAESVVRRISELEPNSAWAHVNLSVYLGKQGKYHDAIAESNRAIEMDKGTELHANLVLASWEWLSGQKDAALKRIASVEVPNDEYGKRSYYSCIACFYASVGDEEKIADAIKNAQAVDEKKTFQDFIATDIVFDPYRRREWFIKLAGKTLQESH